MSTKKSVLQAVTEILWICVTLAAMAEEPDRRTLVFSREPTGRVHFLNETGAEVPCGARGATIRWETREGAPLEEVAGLRQVRPDGTLVFSPFAPDAYRPDVHAAVYRCTAATSAGKIGSRDVHVRGVLRQPYKVQVFDEYTVSGNTAVLRCNIPSFVKDYVIVTSWLRDDSRTIVSGTETGGRYSVFPSGELHIRGAALEDGFKSYRCVTRNRLTGEVSPSAVAGKLYVTDARSGVSPRITHSQPKVETRVGDTVEIPCAAQGYPVPSYSWFRLREGSTRRVDGGGRTVERQGSLLIRGATVQDGGTYLCLVNNSAGQERAHIELLVREPLEVFAVPRWQTVSSGSTALVSCNVSGHPLPSITWLKDLSPVSASRDGLRISGPLRRGLYQCFARNDRESAQDVAQIVLGDVAPVLRSVFEPSVLEPGSSVSLRCSAWGHPLPRVTWSLDDLPVPDHPRFSVGDYVTTARPEVVSFVNVTALRVEDGGVYRCVASNDVGSSSHSAKVHVIGPPFVRPMGDVAAVQGEALVVRCPVAGYPVEEVYWEKEGRRIPFNHRQRGFKNGTFVIRDLDRRSDPGQYTCTARNSQGQKGERTLRITVLTPPVIEPFHFPPAIEEGSRSKILCSVTRGDPPLTVSWLKDGRPLQHEDEDISLTTLDEFSSAILFRRVRLEHRGDYVCVARNTAAQDTFTATMVVHAPPRWVVEPSPTEAVLGSDVTLDCVADGFPKPHVTWKRARDSLASDYDALPSDGHVQSLLNGSLSIRGLLKSDAGSYMCQANNGIGVGIGTLVTLKVRVPAQFREEFVAETVRKGAELVVRCRAFGDRPIVVAWKKDGQSLDQQPEKKYSVEEETTGEDGLTSSIRIESADRRDSSLFTCLARNAFGRDEMNVQIIVQERPDKPFKVTSQERTSRSVSLSWSPPYSGNSPILTYTVQYKPTSSGSWQEESKELTTSGLDSKLSVSGLQPATAYHFRVMAENAFGKSDYSAPITINTDLEVPGGPPSNVQAEAVGSRTLRVTWQPPPPEVHNGPLSGYYVGYKARGSGQPYTYKTLEAAVHECLVTGLRPLTAYHVIVQAFNGKGAGPPSQEVAAHTKDNDPPTHPVLSIKSVTHTSIEVEWEVAPSTSTPIEGFQLHSKREMGGWQELSVARDLRNHLFEGLDCGTRYHFFVTAFNEVGQGLPSEPLAAKTLGVAPVAPPQSLFVRPNATSALLHLSEWRDGGCPVSFFVVQYREEEEGGDWLLASDRLPPPRDERPFELQGLRPHTRYRLHVAAHSDAGVTHAQYAFDTDRLLDDEQTEAGAIPDRRGWVSLYTNLAIVAPVAVTALILLSVLTVVCALGNRRRRPDTQYDDCRSVRKVAANPEASVCMSEYEVKPDFGQSKQPSVYLPSPYATSRVAVFSVADEDPDNAARPYDLPFAAKKGADTKHIKEALTQSKAEHMYSFQRGSRRSMHPEGPFLYPEHVT